MNEGYLCLGGNLGNCLINLNTAIRLIEERAGKSIAKSSVYQSEAWGMESAPVFFNQVIKIETKLPAQELMTILLETEKILGRERTGESGYKNRVMDIDILFFNNEIIKTSSLEIPHPRLHIRNFVLFPLHEIAPGFIHPVFKKTISELVKASPDKGEVKKLNDGF